MSVVTSRSDRGVLSPSGRCCSRARTMQFAMMVVRIIHSNGVQLELRPTSTNRIHTHTARCGHSHCGDQLSFGYSFSDTVIHIQADPVTLKQTPKVPFHISLLDAQHHGLDLEDHQMLSTNQNSRSVRLLSGSYNINSA